MERSFWRSDRERYGKQAWLIQPSYWAVAAFRFGRWTLTAPALLRPGLHGVYFVAYSISRLLTGIDIPRSVEIGPGLMIHHFGGVIIHPQAKIGANCTMRHGLTIGVRRDGELPPTIGDNVVFGAYAQVLGQILVDDGAQIGAMSLVLSDVPAGGTAIGIPARVIRSVPSSEV